MEQELINYCKQMNVGCSILNYNDRNSVAKKIEALYVRENAKYGFSLFDILKCEELIGVNLFESWKWVHDFIEEKSIIVFFDYKMGEYVEIDCGNIFVQFYDDCPKDEFYITDWSGSFLLGYNHSKCLFAMGTASDWLEKSEKYKKFTNEIKK